MSENSGKFPRWLQWLLALFALVAVLPIAYYSGFSFGENMALTENAADAAAIEETAE